MFENAEADIEITPTVPYSDVVSALTNFFGVALVKTGRFDEFPAVIGVVGEHEVIVFDLPADEKRNEPGWNYRLTVTPLDYKIDLNRSDLLIESLKDHLPSCKLTCTT